MVAVKKKEKQTLSSLLIQFNRKMVSSKILYQYNNCQYYLKPSTIKTKKKYQAMRREKLRQEKTESGYKDVSSKKKN